MQPSSRPKLTIKDVARACGVSTQTISRVLNDRVDVSQSTREKVLAVIDQMGYQPSAFARGMRQKSMTLGVILAGLQHKGISTTLKGITQEAEIHGFNLILKELPSFKAKELKPLIQSLMAHQVMGIIYAAPEVGDNWSQVQAKRPPSCPPIVFLKGNSSSAPITISIDNYAGAYEMTRHLIEQRYRHIGHLSGPLDWFEARERKRGWTQALADAGRPVNDAAWSEGAWDPASGRDAFERLSARYPKMDAVFVANDQMALAVLNAAHQHGLGVPQQLGVAGFDGISESAYYLPPLTTIKQNFRELGAFAVRKILHLQEAEKKFPEVAADTTILTPELVVRESTLRL
ncbi:MAG: LacI family DNA-binding transcriptional regulator [Desulfosarcinaceae bacterium]|jgi:DNA-binding LacI/PurR family transcriptional regulator